MPRVFPEPGIENVVIGIETGKMGQTFSCLMMDTVPDCCVFGYTQCFPLYTYEKKEASDELLVTSEDKTHPAPHAPHHYIRRENISDAILQKFQQHYSPLAPHPSPLITKEDIFYYVYGILHSNSYRERFAANLKKQLPRIPLVGGECRVVYGEKRDRPAGEDSNPENSPLAPRDSQLFWTFSKAGRKLGDLHVHYETLEPFPLNEQWRETRGEYRVVKMKLTRRSPHSTLHYNEHLTLDGIPPETFRYVLNGKSALEWVMERYKITTHPDSGIVNDPNDWCQEQGNARYIVDLVKRIIRLSVESVKIIESLPELEF
jgi:predicted helicase